MRKLKLQVQISVDGYIGGPNGEMDWLEWNWGDDIKQYVGYITEPIDTIVLGRKLAEGLYRTGPVLLQIMKTLNNRPVKNLLIRQR